MRKFILTLCLLSLVGCAEIDQAKKWAGEQLDKAGKVIEDLKEKVDGK